jgi:iron complex transport system permease protein
MSEPRALPPEKPIWPLIVGGLVVLALAALLGLAWGTEPIRLWDAFHPNTPRGGTAAEIVWRLRLPSVVLAALVGAVLALAGLLFQALLRNPLASPFTLGVAGGGSLGAFIVITLGGSAFAVPFLDRLAPWGFASATAVGAFVGVLATVGLVFALARAAGGVQTVTLLLAGVTLNYVCAAGVMLLQSISDFAQTMKMVRWSMGGLDAQTSQIAPTLALVVLGFVITLPALRHLDVLSLDDETARLLGVPVRRVRAQIILGTAIMVGAVLAVAGPIGFVGLLVPHAGRLIVGPSHRRLLPLVVCGGAALLIVADALGRGIPSHLLGRAGVIPVGVITAALGGPFFLALLLGLGRQGALGEKG